MSKFSRKAVAVGLALTTAVWLAGSIIPASAQTTAATIASLMAQIRALQAQLTALQSSSGSSVSSSYSYTRDLTVGSKGADVTALQQMLVSGGYLTMPKGVAYGYFGPLTKAALGKYQAAKGITPSVGYFGPKTRAYVASTSSVTTTTSTTSTTSTTVVVPSGTGLLVQIASDSPGALTIGSGTAFNPALKFVLAAGAQAVSVTGITVHKGGFISNTTLNGVDIVDQLGNRYGNVVTSINADGSIGITFPTTPLNIPANSSVELTVRFNVSSVSNASTVSFSLNSASDITSNASSVGGSFPITGAAMQVVNGTSAIASTTLDVLTSTGSSTVNVTSGEQEITKFRIRELSSNEGMYLKSWTLYNYGNADATNYGSVKLISQDGNVLATAEPSGQYVTFTLATPYFIDKGQTRDFAVDAVILGGTTKTINLVTYNNYDINLVGATTGVSILPSAITGDNDTSFPIGNGFNIQTIGQGTVTLSRASDTPSSAVVPGANQVTLAKFDAKPTGENMELRQVSFYIATSTANSYLLTGTVYVQVNGAIVYSTAASNISPITATTYTLSSYPILTSGQDNYITIQGSVNSSATSSSSYQVSSFDLIQVKRLITGDLVDPGTSAVSGLTIPVNGAALSVTTLSTPVANSVVAGTSHYLLAQATLNAQTSGESIKVTKISFVDANTSSSTDTTNMTLYIDGQSSALVTNSTPTVSSGVVAFNLTNPIVVTQSAPITLDLYGDISSSAGNTDVHTFKVQSSGYTAYGASTGNSVTPTFAGGGQGQTVASSGNLTLSLVSGSGASPSTNQIVNVGTTGGVYLAFKMTSQYETQKITSLKITATSSSATSLATTTLQSVRIYEDSLSGTPIYPSTAWSCTSGQCTATWGGSGVDNIFPSPISVTGNTIYVVANVGAGGIANLADNFQLQVASTSDVAVKGSVTGSTSGTVTGTPKASGITYVVPQDVEVAAVSPTTATTIGLSAGGTVGIFKITNNGTAPIYLSTSTLTFTNGGSATTTTSFKVYASAVGGGQSDTSGWNSGNGYLAAAGTTGASSSISFATSTFTSAEQKIDGGSWRYITIKTTAAAASNDTVQLSVSALGNILYNVNESDLGYSGTPSAHSTITSTVYGLYANSLPSLATVTLHS